MYSFLLLLFSIVPLDNLSRDIVDVIHINHFYDEHGRLVFDQIIFKDWTTNVKVYKTVNTTIQDEANSIINLEKTIETTVDRFQVRAWRLIKTPHQIPTRDWSNGGYFVLWMDGEHMRYIHAKSITEDWTQYDPELVEREFLDKDKRKELRTIEVKRKKNDVEN